jgi:hypothetical protein
MMCEQLGPGRVVIRELDRASEHPSFPDGRCDDLLVGHRLVPMGLGRPFHLPLASFAVVLG